MRSGLFLTRRDALIGAAALLAPLPSSILVAAPSVPASRPGLIRLDSNENPHGPSPVARRAILATAGGGPGYANETIATLTNQLAAREGEPFKFLNNMASGLAWCPCKPRESGFRRAAV